MLARDLISLYREVSLPVDEIKANVDALKAKGQDTKTLEITVAWMTKANPKIPDRAIKALQCIELWNSGIKGIGPAKAIELWDLGVRLNNIETPKYKALLPEITQTWLKYKPINQIPHKIIQPLVKAFMPQGREYKIVGSYRRGKPYSRDLDILYVFDSKKSETIRAELLQKLMAELSAKHGDRWILLAQGPEKISGIYVINSKQSVEVDMWLADKSNNYAAMELYSTGSKSWNILMRRVAINRGYKLNQYGLFDKAGKPISGLKTEKDIFDKLGMQYREPAERE